ncbi:NADH:ubiquinone oxidoreductase subunit NDUFA12 [Rhodobaculum claviforme]|uniref:NADH:ubiquinone oxidoreductase subunit NDUFA12 n=1 Tax=Rhodobaculum claviforme TaxID=1549854 RepID=A0A934WI70_9RHOB|nr:NADH:ubiquinone oxidoreductase subunit NDUFA12 [Rhodobaculum claviforme]MBK5927900.1 NADH:ubiquinone oxidoreductase subunit NDUFA12 [Rhodobaculum claviforme]
MLKTLIGLVTWWNNATFGTLLHTRRHGERVGADDQGNVFYQSDGGKRRWVIYNGETEASRIAPDWHGWLHHTWNTPPTEAPLRHRAWEKPHLANQTGTALAYAPPGSIRRQEPAPKRDYEAWTPE